MKKTTIFIFAFVAIFILGLEFSKKRRVFPIIVEMEESIDSNAIVRRNGSINALRNEP